jgi:hypothetical protein
MKAVRRKGGKDKEFEMDKGKEEKNDLLITFGCALVGRTL